MRNVSKIEPIIPSMPTRKKVAAYARVSMETERLQHSISAQISYYSNLIQNNPEWEYAGVYADDGISGTKTRRRSEFNRMIADCEAGKIDIILTKSISRFARNTVDLLNTVRHLKEIGVEVRFEKENINSLSGDGEVMLTLLASFAQEEVRSISENVKWGTRKRFEQGIPNGRFMIYGYRWEGDRLVVYEEEAKIVRLIYDNFLNGLSAETTEKQLEEMGIKSYKGQHFGNTSIRNILTNVTYTGNMLFQKEYVVDPISQKSKKNRGELPQYWVEDTHEAIIPMETFQAVQNEIARRRALGARANWSINTTCLTSKIKCGLCGKSFQRSNRKGRLDKNASYTIWVCATRKSGKQCQTKDIPEVILKRECCSVLGIEEFDDEVFAEQIDHIDSFPLNRLVFYFVDGRVVERFWQSNLKKEWWTPERREACSQSRMGVNRSKKYHNPFTGYFKCACCGANFRRQTTKYVDGTTREYWRCPNSAKCGNTSRPDEPIAKQLIAEAIGIAEFDEVVFKEKVDFIMLAGGCEMDIHLKDGAQVIKVWEPHKKKCYPWTEERHEKMKRTCKDLWTDERRKAMSDRIKQIRSEKHWGRK